MYQDGTIIFFSTRDSFKRLIKRPLAGLIQKFTNGFWEHCGICCNGKYYEVLAKKGVVEKSFDELQDYCKKNANTMLSAYSLPIYEVSNIILLHDILIELQAKQKYSYMRAFFSAVDELPFMRKIALWLIKKEPIDRETFCSKFVFKALRMQPQLANLKNYDSNKISPNELKKLLIDELKIYSELKIV